MFKKLSAVASLLIASLLVISVSTRGLTQSVIQFVQGLFLATGVAVDLNGNVFVASDSGTSEVVSKFAPNGAFLGQIPIGGFTVGFQGKIATNPVTGQLFFLGENGQLFLIDPNSGAASLLVNLTAIPIDTSDVFDIATNTRGNFGGSLGLTSFFSYGDLAVVQYQNGVIDIFVTGLSQAQAYPFVMRLRFQNGALIQAKVVASSVASMAGSFNIAPGIAVNNQGIVLTTLPIPARRPEFGNYSTPVAFNTEFDLTPDSVDDPRIVLGGIDLSTKGMTADAAGNFYVAGTSVGSTLGGVAAGSGGVYVFPPTLDSVVAALPAGGLPGTYDVAVSPTADRVYVTTGKEVLAFLLR